MKESWYYLILLLVFDGIYFLENGKLYDMPLSQGFIIIGILFIINLLADIKKKLKN